MTLDRRSPSAWGLSPASASSDRFGQNGTGSSVPLNCVGLIHSSSRPLRIGQSYIVLIDEEQMDTEAVSTPWPLLNHLYARHYESSAARDQLRDYLVYHVWHSAGAPPVPAPAPEIITHHDQVADITHTFSLNATQLAGLFGVSRQTIYNWRKGETIDTAYRSRLKSLHDFVRDYRLLDPAPIGPALTWIDTTSGQSLLDLLGARPHDHTAIARYLKALPARIAEHFTEANAAITRNKDDGFAPIPDEWRQHTLRSIGAQNSTQATLPPGE